MWQEIVTWQETLKVRPDLSAKTVALHTQDARRFATWLQHEHPGLKVSEVTTTDAKAYRDSLLAKRYAPTTINRALISLMLFFDTIEVTNPFRHLTMIEVIEPAPVALSKTEWNAVRRCAEAAARRDHGLALALAALFRYAGPRVSEVAALQIPDVQVSARRGLLIIRRGKGVKSHLTRFLTVERNEQVDSSLVVSQLLGLWKIKDPKMQQLAGEMREHLHQLPGTHTFEYIPREENKYADRLANDTLDSGIYMLALERLPPSGW